jgi:hypothetical protein
MRAPRLKSRAAALLLCAALAPTVAAAEEPAAPLAPAAPAEATPAAAPAPVAPASVAPASVAPASVAPPGPVLALPGPSGAGPAVAGAPALTMDRLQTLRRYKAERLSVHEETELRGGGTAMAMGYPYGRMGPSTAVMMTDPVYTVRTWGVYQGPDRISTPSFLDKVGKASEATALREDVARYQRRSKGCFGVAGIGAGVLVAGLIGMRAATTPEEYLAWNLATLGGTAAGMGGLVVGSFPAAKASRLERSPATVMTPAEARALAERHNDALQKQLGVTPQEAWLLELGQDR